MMNGDQVYGWPENGYPAPQGPFYCGVGDESTYGRPLAEKHLDACVEADLKISGINAEVCASVSNMNPSLLNPSVVTNALPYCVVVVYGHRIKVRTNTFTNAW